MQVSNNIKKFLHVLLFFVIFIVLLFVTSQLFFFFGKKSTGKVQDRNTNITSIQVEKENTIDVLVLGDSLSYASISPMQLFEEKGVTSYICGQHAQRIFETYTALENGLKTQSPKVVLLETNLFYRYKGNEVQLELFEDIQNLFPIFRYHNVWKQMLFGATDTRRDYKGFIIRDWAHAYEGRYDYMDIDNNKCEEVKEYVYEYMDKTVALCKERGIQILLYSTPSPKCYNGAKHNGLVAFANKYNLEYIDLNEYVDEIGIDWRKDTVDKGDHLNLYGAQKVTSFMGDYLVSHYNLTDYRGTQLGDEWSKMVEEYKQEMESRKK